MTTQPGKASTRNVFAIPIAFDKPRGDSPAANNVPLYLLNISSNRA